MLAFVVQPGGGDVGVPEPLQRSPNAREDSNVKAGEEEQNEQEQNPSRFAKRGLRLWCGHLCPAAFLSPLDLPKVSLAGSHFSSSSVLRGNTGTGYENHRLLLPLIVGNGDGDVFNQRYRPPDRYIRR